MKPAILGGAPAFAQPLAFTRPTVPPYAEMVPYFENIVSSGALTKGAYCQQLEQRLAEYIGVPHVVCLSSCSSGLMLGIQCLGLKGEVIVPSFSFMATFNALRWNSLTPVYVECEPDTLTVDVDAVKRAVTPRTSAVMSAYLFGNPPAFDELNAFCREKGLVHFCDSAHGMGSLYHGRPAGGQAEFEVFSASPTKLLTAAEGGFLATRSPELAAWATKGRDYGNPGSYDCEFAGLNARMSEFHAVIALLGLDRLDSYALHRGKIANLYTKRLGLLPGLSFQKVRDNCRSSNKDFAILVDEPFGLGRDQLIEALKQEGVPTRIYFAPPGHRLTAHRVQPEPLLPITDSVCSRILCVPISSHMAFEEVERICAVVENIHRHAGAIRDALGAVAV